MSEKSELVYIGKVPVGEGYPTVFVAEVGTFFNQDIGMAKDFLKKSVDAGAPVFKTEILHNPEVCYNDPSQLHEYHHVKGTHTEVYRELIERKCVDFAGYSELFKECRALDVPYIASVYDFDGIDFFVEEGGSALKIARNNINNYPLIKYAASKKLPMIFDAGVTYIDEIAYAVRLAQENGANGVIVNHHPGANPATPAMHNMKVMKMYQEMLKIPVGLSCHYQGNEILYMAVGMGANLLEKGVVDDPTKVEQDIISAASLEELPDVIQKVQNCWEAIGDSIPRHNEPRDFSTRSGVVAKSSLKAGDKLSLENCYFAWPPKGISVEHWELIEGKPLRHDVKEKQPIEFKHIDF